MASEHRRKKSGWGWAGIAGILISVVLLWWTLHDISLGQLTEHLETVRLAPFVACVLVSTFTFLLRTVRWQYILQLEGEKLPFTPLWHATAIGFMANNLLPARAGEFARAFAIGRLTGVRFTSALASLVVERVMDGLALVTMLVLAIVIGGFNTGTTVGGVTLGSTILFAGSIFVMLPLAAAVWAVHWPERAMKIGGTVANVILPKRWADKTDRAMIGIFDGLTVLRDWRRFGIVALWSFIVWGVNGVSFLLCMVAFGLEVPWTAAYILQSLIAFGVAAPSAPGFFGVFEAVTRATLTLYAVPVALSVSYAFGYHLFTFVPITVLGLYSLSRARLHLADLGAGRSEQAGSD